MLISKLLNNSQSNEEEALRIIELTKLFEIDKDIYQTLLEKDSIDINEFFQIAFAFLDYRIFNLFIDFTINNLEFICGQLDNIGSETLLCNEKYIKEIIDGFERVKEINKLNL